MNSLKDVIDTKVDMWLSDCGLSFEQVSAEQGQKLVDAVTEAVRKYIRESME